MTIEEHPNIKDLDWRLQFVSTITHDFRAPGPTITHPAGSAVILSSRAKFHASLLGFSLPSMTALFIDFSSKAWNEAQLFLASDLNDHFTIKGDGSYGPKNEADFFEALELRMAAVVFAYSSLESFANESIPENHIFKKNKQDGKCIEEYNKEQIEKWLSLDIKLDEILPSILKISSPKGSAYWQRYIKLKNLRDRIIHMKSKDRKSSGPDDETIWKELLDTSKPNFAVEAKDIIGYYLNNHSKPRWFIKFPNDMKV